MFDKLNAVEAQYERLMTEMADPGVQGDAAKIRSAFQDRGRTAAAGRSVPRVQETSRSSPRPKNC